MGSIGAMRRLARSLRADTVETDSKLVPKASRDACLTKERWQNGDSTCRGLRAGMGYTAARPLESFRKRRGSAHHFSV